MMTATQTKTALTPTFESNRGNIEAEGSNVDAKKTKNEGAESNQQSELQSKKESSKRNKTIASETIRNRKGETVQSGIKMEMKEKIIKRKKMHTEKRILVRSQPCTTRSNWRRKEKTQIDIGAIFMIGIHSNFGLIKRKCIIEDSKKEVEDTER